MTQLDKDVEKRFDEQFKTGSNTGYVSGWTLMPKDIKQFLAQELAAAKEAGAREAETSEYARSFYRFADSRNLIPEEYDKAIIWFLRRLEEFDND